jgi:hypothetical protein
VREQVTADDVRAAVAASVTALAAEADQDWSVPAGELEWTCWETAEHVADDLFAYALQLGPEHPPVERYVPVVFQQKRAGGPDSTIFVDHDAGVAGLLQILEACGALLTAMVRTTPPSVRAFHPYGVSDPEGFAAMGIVEVLVHTHDIATGLGILWVPDEHLCGKALSRLFPEAPADTPRWETLLWATGRGRLPGRERPAKWRWHSDLWHSV